MRTSTLMKKKTIVTRQVTTVDDMTGEILEQKTEQVIQTDSDEEDEVAEERLAAGAHGYTQGEPDGIMTMHDSRTDKTYKIAIRNNKMKASDLLDIKDPRGKGLTIEMH